MHPEHRWAFTIVTPDGQYTFNCAIMGFKNSNAYVQRQMDNLLEGTGADSYCDDIVASSQTFEEHIETISTLLNLLRSRNMSIGPSKSFAGFPNAVVLGRMVDAFGMSKVATVLPISTCHGGSGSYPYSGFQGGGAVRDRFLCSAVATPMAAPRSRSGGSSTSSARELSAELALELPGREVSKRLQQGRLIRNQGIIY